ncbi:MAG: C2H2-type zinc finger protein [Thermosphaera sp.]
MVRKFFESEVKNVLMFRNESVRVAFAVSKCVDIDRVAMKVCPFCGKKFKTKFHLAHHMYSHAEFSGLVECVKEVLKGWLG